MDLRVRTLGDFGVTQDGAPVTALAGQPIRTALFLILSLERSTTRDAVIGLLWPELPPTNARHVLNQTLYNLRQELGEACIRSEGEALCAGDCIQVDALHFAEAVEAKDWEAAVALYRGPFLAGWYFAATQAFEEWAELWRGRLERAHRGARRALIAARRAAGKEAEALALAVEWAELCPLEDEAQHLAIELLSRAGRRADALRRYERYRSALAEEGLHPLPKTEALVVGLRSLPLEDSLPTGLVGQPGTEVAAPVPAAAAARPRRRINGRMLGVTLAVAVLGLMAAYLLLTAPGRMAPTSLGPRRAVVVPFENRTGDTTLDVVGWTAADWISEGLVATQVLTVVPTVDVQDALRLAAGNRRLSRVNARRVATYTHATVLVTGSVYRRGDSLELRPEVSDLRTDRVVMAGPVVRAPRTNFADAIEALRQRIMGQVTALYGPLLEPSQALDYPPRYDAYRALVEGETRYARGDYRGAIEQFRVAVQRDSSCVRALLEAGTAHLTLGEYAEADSIARCLSTSVTELTPYESAHYRYLQAILQGDLRAAFQATGEAARLAPGGGMQFLEGLLALQLNQPRTTLRIYSSFDPERGLMRYWVPYWLVRTEALHILGDHDQELADANAGRHLHPGVMEICFAQLRAHIARGDTAQLPHELTRCSALRARGHWDRARLLEEVAIELNAHGYPKSAHDALAEAVALRRDCVQHSPANPDSLLALARTLYLAHADDEARTLLERVAGARPGNREVVGRLGVLAARQGEAATARQFAERLDALAGPYDFGESLAWRARIAAQLGHITEAVEWIRRAHARGLPYGLSLLHDPDLQPIWNYLYPHS